MATEMYSNNVAGSISAALTSTATSLTANGYTAFPSVGQFTVLIESEIILVTGGQGTATWTIVRGQEGTTATSHQSGAAIYATVTDGSLRRLVRQSHGGTNVSARRETNFIDGGGITWSLTDDAANDKCDLQGAVAGSKSPIFTSGSATYTVADTVNPHLFTIDLTGLSSRPTMANCLAHARVNEAGDGNPNQTSGAIWCVGDISFSNASHSSSDPPDTLYVRIKQLTSVGATGYVLTLYYDVIDKTVKGF